MDDRKRKLADASGAFGGGVAGDDAASAKAQLVAPDLARANAKRKAGAHLSGGALAATEADPTKKTRIEFDAVDTDGGGGGGAAANASGVLAPRGGAVPTDGQADDFVAKLAEQLQKIALYGNAFFAELAFGGHVAAATGGSGGGGGGGGARGGGAGSSVPRDSVHFDKLQANRGRLFALVEEMLRRAHEIDDDGGGGAPTDTQPHPQHHEAEDSFATTPAPAGGGGAGAAVVAASQAARRAAVLRESNAELSRRGKEMAGVSALLDAVTGHLSS
jgi:hypothetical protein